MLCYVVNGFCCLCRFHDFILLRLGLGSFEISKNIQSVKIVRSEPSFKQCFNCLIPFRHVSSV